MNPLDHTQARQLLQAAADYRLEPAAQAALDAHLANCPDCRAYGQDTGALEQGLRTLFHRQWDQPAARVINLLPGVRGAYHRRQARRRLLSYAATLMTLALVAGLLVGLNSFLASRQPPAGTGGETPARVGTQANPYGPTATITPVGADPRASPTPTATVRADPRPSLEIPAGTLAFVSSRSELGDLFLMNADGSGQALFLDDQLSLSMSPAWSPDGAKLAFVSGRDGNHEIYTVNADGSALTRLTDDPAADSDPAWSPDGSRIAFSSDRSGYQEIYVMDAAGGHVTRLTETQAANEHPTWSPDGASLAFASNRDGYWQIYRMRGDGSQPTNLSNDPHSDDRQPAWSPDGVRIAYSAQPVGTQDHRIAVMNAGGSGRTHLTQPDAAQARPAGEYYPAWSPDSQWIAFASVRENTAYGDIYLLRLDPAPSAWSDILRLTIAGGTQPNWRP